MDKLLFRASSLGKLMTNAKTKTGLSETCKSALLDIYLREKYSRTNDISNKYIEKGLAVERDSIDVWRRHAGEIVFQNTKRFNNDYITGLPDLLIKDAAGNCVNVPDIKSSWSLHTFANSVKDDISKDYYWQGQAYMWLTGSVRATFCYVLVNAPSQMIDDEKYKLARRMNLIDAQADPAFVKQAQQIERNMIYDMPTFLAENPNAQLESDLSAWTYDIPVEKRIHEKVVLFDADAIAKLQERVPMWREYLNTIAL